MKRIITMFLAIIIMISILASCKKETAEYVHSPPFEETMQSKYVYLYNVDTDTLVYSKGHDQGWRQRSLNQLMTAILVLDLEKSDGGLENTEIKSNEATFAGISGQRVPNIDMHPEETYTPSDLLHAMLLEGSYDAANLLAQHYGGEGGIDSFVDSMNRKAQELELIGTSYKSPSGISTSDKDEYTSIYDIYLLTRIIMERYPRILDISRTKNYEIAQRTGQNPYKLTNRDKLFDDSSSYYMPSIVGGFLAGYEDFGDISVSVAEINNLKYILVVAGTAYSGIEITKNDDLVYDVERKTSKPLEAKTPVDDSLSSSISDTSSSSEEDSSNDSSLEEKTDTSESLVAESQIYTEVNQFYGWAQNTIDKVLFSNPVTALGNRYSTSDFSITVKETPELEEGFDKDTGFYLYMVNSIDSETELKKNDVVGKAILANSPNSPSIDVIAVESDKKMGFVGFLLNLLKFVGIAFLIIVVAGFLIIFGVRYYNIRKIRKKRRERQQRLANQRKNEKNIDNQ